MEARSDQRCYCLICKNLSTNAVHYCIVEKKDIEIWTDLDALLKQLRNREETKTKPEETMEK